MSPLSHTLCNRDMFCRRGRAKHVDYFNYLTLLLFLISHYEGNTSASDYQLSLSAAIKNTSTSHQSEDVHC